MMAIIGIDLLPPKVTTEEALNLYKKVARIKSKIGRLHSELQHSIVNTQLIQMLTLKESVQSTRIEGTQVTFADIIDNATKKISHQKSLKLKTTWPPYQKGVS